MERFESQDTDTVEIRDVEKEERDTRGAAAGGAFFFVCVGSWETRGEKELKKRN